MARLMRAKDWGATRLGPAELWPESLKVALRILLTSRFDIWLGWGPDIAFFYNDAYRPTLGLKHPDALGTPTRQLWREIWADIEPRIRAVYDNGQATWDRALLLLLERNGYPEETYHTFSYSPLLGDDGRVEGLFCVVSEETDRVISERRLGLLRVLASGLASATMRTSVLDAARTAIAADPHDLPFSLTYLFEPDGSARLACATGMSPGHPAAPERLDPNSATFWTLADAESVVGLTALADLPTGPWKQPPNQAVVIPLVGQGGDAPAGAMVVGLNPHRAFDADYLSFLKLIAGQISSSLASADAYEAERRRALALAEAAQLRQEAAEALQQANATLANEVRLRTAERDRLRNLFQRAPGFMCVLRGPDHVFEFMNEAYLQLVGHRDLTGLPVSEALPEIASQGFFELLDEVFHTGQPFVGREMPVNIQREPGAPLEQRVLNLVYQPIVEGDGTISGIFAEGHDVTEQKRAERALRDANETLEQRIAAALAERERIEEVLRQSQKMEAVGQLTGGLAHDFNNLLTGITGSLELLNTRLTQGRIKELDRYIVAAQGAANRAAALTHRLLAFARRQTLDPKPTNVNRLVSDMEELIRRTIGPAVVLETVGMVGLWTTLVDPNQLENALLNLCINARDAMPNGGRLTVETGNRWLDDRAARDRELTPGQYVSLCVCDTGTGMSPEIIARAFDPFFTTKPLGMGTGLGLSMIYGFAKQSGGQVRIYSEVGQGTMVCIYLPRHYGDAEDRERAADLADAPRAEQGETVLVVDDEPTVRMLVSDVLENLGYQPIEAADGSAGLKVLQSGARIDLLITDVGLPGGMNGRQLADAARKTRPDLKVLFITGYAENSVVGNGYLEPGMQVLTKPFAMEALATRIKDLILVRPSPAST